MPRVVADRVQTGQVVGNLLLNAIEAMAAPNHAGRLLQIRAAMDGPGQIRFSIADSGIGIPSVERDHLFDAFWTTKP
ncbi:ATP-binding protein, partial [Escherichia coli]|uniref:ATP-binding protein n=1 Tax=Escherichia coli TaxID=562 RepID=UPI00207C83D1